MSAVCAAIGLALTGCSSSPSGAHKPATAKGAVVASPTCSAIGPYVQCVMPGTANEVSLSSLVTEASEANSGITTTTPMVVTAYGASGGANEEYAIHPGAPGEAQTITTEAGYASTYGTTDLYYYLGSQLDPPDDWGGPGGASTIAASADLTAAAACIANVSGPCPSTNVVLDAGGGGGGGGSSGGCGTGAGGQGGVAIASLNSGKVTGGSPGDDGGCYGGHGGQGGDGTGGQPGRAGGGSDAIAGQLGQSGLGGAGGPAHTGGGPSGVAAWVVNANLSVGTAGQGGEGEWRGSVEGVPGGPGGGGGGGFGGGGGGGGGGQYVDGGGGGGGGSYAAPGTTTSSVTAFDLSSSGDGNLIIDFVPAA